MSTIQAIFTNSILQTLYLQKTEHIHIFLAEDDQDDKEFFGLALNKVNSTALLTVASNGAEALEYFRRPHKPPHFIFLDINMPLVDGFECLKQIRLVHPPESLPVIMLSTSGAHHMIERSFIHGASFYLQKPNHLDELAGHIRFCLEELIGRTPSNRYLVNG
jgi:DNA-binding response OmpR family regulator